MARQVAGAFGLEVEVHHADWATDGRSAGPRRNARMVAMGADLCLAFPLIDSVGTRHTMHLASKAGIPVFNHGAKFPEKEKQ